MLKQQLTKNKNTIRASLSFLVVLLIPILLACQNRTTDPYVLPTESAPVISPTSIPYSFPWLEDTLSVQTLQNRINVPAGFNRKTYPLNSFGDYLRNLPLKEGTPEVLLFDGTKKYNQSAHAAVFNIDVGKKDLQQCADAVMRLRAEFLWATKQEDQIAFNFTSGDRCDWKRWKSGERPIVNGNKVTWEKKSGIDGTYKNFKSYLQMVFNYAGSLSLSCELNAKKLWSEIESGDVIIKGGTPGHAVIVMDVVVDNHGNKLFLLAQSYMPAQEIQLLKNPNNASLSPWYKVDEIGDRLITPEYYFLSGSLMCFP